MRLRRIPAVREAARVGGFPAVVVVLALLALLVVPIPLRERVNAVRDELDSYATPAGDQIAEIQYLLARQSSSLRGYLITLDPADLRRFRDWAAQERAIYPALVSNAARLTPEIAADVAQLETLSIQWHDRLETDLAALDDPDRVTFPTLEQELYRQSLEAATGAMQALRAYVREQQAEIDRAEGWMRALYILLFLVAAAAAVAVAALNGRIRRLARDADTRRAEVERAMRQTERAVAARADLIRGFTHDVKNPLGVADGFAELLELGLRGELNEEQRQTVAKIRGSIRGAIDIINDLLDLSRLESGGLRVASVPVNLAKLTAEVADQHTRAAEGLGLELTFVDPPAGAKLEARTDPDRVRQILQNLVSNAIKYTPPPGDIRVRVQVAPGPDGQGGAWAALQVVDSGPGIPAEEQERIFDEFHRVPGSGGGGHGLGLAISRRIARMLGGDVTVRSVLGQGCTFTLWLPLPGSGAERSGPPATFSGTTDR